MKAIADKSTNKTTMLSFWGDSRIRSQYMAARKLVSGSQVKIDRNQRHSWMKHNDTDINTVVVR